MKIPSINFLYPKSPLNFHGSYKVKNEQAFVGEPEQNFVPDVEVLSSKFDINFSNKTIFDDIEQKIIADLNPLEFDVSQMKSAIKANSDILLINEAFKNDEIDYIAETGISLNAALSYLHHKGHIKLHKPAMPKNYAFFVDELSVRYLENVSKKFENAGSTISDWVNLRNIKFYSLNLDEQEVEEFKNRLEKILKYPIEIRRINNPNNSHETMFPCAKEIKETIKSCAEHYFPNDETTQKKYIDSISKYLKTAFVCYSYQTIACELKRAYSIIEKHMHQKGKTMEDVVYFIPDFDKSYGIINYIYGMENVIEPEKFKSIRTLHNNDNGKTFVILDDCSFSGESLIESAENLRYLDVADEIIAMPIVANERAISAISGAEYMNFMPINRIFSFLDDESDENDEFSKEEIDFLKKHIVGGINDQHVCVIFPYMVPDNCSDITGEIGNYFLINNDNRANKPWKILVNKNEILAKRLTAI